MPDPIDWKAVASALGLDIPTGELERADNALRGLEARLRPLLRDVAPGLDPAFLFRADPERRE
jgi:hypothetical protein